MHFSASGSFDHLAISPVTSPVTDSGVSVTPDGRPPAGPFGNRRGIQRGSGAFQQHQTPNHAAHHEGGNNNNAVVVRFDKLDPVEIKDLLVCFLHLVKGVDDDVIVGWWEQASEYEILDFFGLLEICLLQFRYRGRRTILSSMTNSPTHSTQSTDSRAQTLPSRTPNPLAEAQRSAYLSGVFGEPKGSSDQLPKGYVPTKSDLEAAHRVLLESNLSTEVGTIVLDLIGVYMNKFKEKLEDNGGDNTKVRRCDEADLIRGFLVRFDPGDIY